MHYDIEITLLNQTEAVPPKPMPEMAVGDTVRYFSTAGKVTITFPALSPFRTDDTAETDITTDVAPFPKLARAGTFASGCAITLPDQTKVGWPMAGANSGGEHVVK